MILRTKLLQRLTFQPFLRFYGLYIYASDNADEVTVSTLLEILPETAMITGAYCVSVWSFNPS